MYYKTKQNGEHVLSTVYRSLQYLVGPAFAAITAWTRLSMDSTNLWQSPGVMELQACLMDTFSCSIVSRQAAILFFAILQRFRWDWDPESLPAKTGPASHTWETTYSFSLSGFGIMGRSQVVLECELVTSKQLLSRRKQKMFQDLLIDSSSDICSQRTQRSNSSCRHSYPDHCGLWKFNAAFCVAGFVSFVGFFQTRGPRFSNEMQNFNSSEKITRDHCSTVQ